MLEVRQLHAGYGSVEILRGIDLDVGAGEIVAVLGSNGVGKSTLNNNLSALYRPFAGSIRFKGEELVGCSSSEIVKRGLIHVPEGRRIFPNLNVRENLELPPIVKPGGLTLDEIYGLFPRLLERTNSQGTKLSGGEQQMLAIARILRTGARFLLLDEPTEGLAPVIVQQIGQIIRTLKQKGFTVLLVEQNFRFASTVADRHFVVEHGQVVDMFTNDQIESNRAKLEEYLGV